MNTKCLNNPQILGAPPAKKRLSFSEKLLAKTIAQAFEFGDGDNYELQHAPFDYINVSRHCPSHCSCHVLLGMLTLLAARSLLKPHCKFFRGKRDKHGFNTQFASLGHCPIFWGLE